MKKILNFLKNIFSNLFFGRERSLVGKKNSTQSDEPSFLVEIDGNYFNSQSNLFGTYIREDRATEGFSFAAQQKSSFYSSQTVQDVAVNDTTQTKNTIILVPVGNRIEPQVDVELRKLEDMGFTVVRQYGYSAIDQARNRMTHYALYESRQFDSILWIDSDVLFKVEDVLRIISHDEPICSGAYPFKNPNSQQMTLTSLDGKKIHFGKDGLTEIECAATGFLYIKKEVFDTMIGVFNMPRCNTSFDQPCYPFFKPDVWKIKGDDLYLGEDYSFCMRAREAGYQIMLDPKIRLKHIGNYEYDWKDIYYGDKPEVQDFELNPIEHKKNINSGS